MLISVTIVVLHLAASWTEFPPTPPKASTAMPHARRSTQIAIKVKIYLLELLQSRPPSENAIESVSFLTGSKVFEIHGSSLIVQILSPAPQLKCKIINGVADLYRRVKLPVLYLHDALLGLRVWLSTTPRGPWELPHQISATNCTAASNTSVAGPAFTSESSFEANRWFVFRNPQSFYCTCLASCPYM